MTMNRGSCPYYMTSGLPDAQRGECSFGCRDEPVCITSEPEGGWPAVIAPRRTTCRYLETHPRRGTNQCTSEATDGENAEIKLCIKHLALALELVKARISAAADDGPGAP
jgi:hypothetical protein